MNWELVGWGSPTAGDAVSRQSESYDWHNMEAGDRAPTDADIAASTEAVIRIDHEGGGSEYYTLHLDIFDNLDDLTEYIEDVFVEQYA